LPRPPQDAIKVAVENISKILNVVSQKALALRKGWDMKEKHIENR
jgi:hypothetical protein